MTKKINKVRILERLRSRLDLEEGSRPELFEVIEKILLTTSVDALLVEWDIDTTPMARLHASGSGFVNCHTVPPGKRQHVRAIDVSRLSGDMTITYIRLLIEGSTPVRVFNQAAAGALTTLILPQDVIMEEGDELEVYATAVAADSTWTSYIYRAEEDAF